MVETSQSAAEREKLPIMPEKNRPPQTPEELRDVIEKGKKEISQFEKGEEDRAAVWEERQSVAGTDPEIIRAAVEEFEILEGEAQGVLSAVDRGLATIGYRGTGEYLIGSDGKPSLEFIEKIPEQVNKGVQEPEPDGVYIGAVQEPDGTWDMSQALRMRDESAKKYIFERDVDQLIQLYRESYKEDEHYETRDGSDGSRDMIDIGARELKALANANDREVAGKAEDYLTGLEMVFDRVTSDDLNMITDVELLGKGTITEDDHQRVAEGYERSNEMFGNIGEKLFPNANCELSAANYNDILQRMSGITGFSRAENNDVSWYCPEGMGPDNMQEILGSGDSNKIKKLSLHLNMVASEALIAFHAVSQSLYGETYANREKDDSAAQAAEFAYRLRNMTQEAVKLAYGGEEGRTIYDAQKDLFGAQDQENDPANNAVEPSLITGEEEAEGGGERKETSDRLSRDLDALRTLSKTGLPDLFGELERVKTGQESQENFTFIADSLDTPLDLVEASGERSESIDKLFQKLKEIQSDCRDERLPIEEKNRIFVQKLEELQGFLKQEYNMIPQRSEQGSDYDRRSQRVVGTIRTNDPLLAGKVAESIGYGFNDPDYTYEARGGVINRLQVVGHEPVVTYKYNPDQKQDEESEAVNNSQDKPSVQHARPENNTARGNIEESTDAATIDKPGDDISEPTQTQPRAKKEDGVEEANPKEVNSYDQIRTIRDDLIEGGKSMPAEKKTELINNLVRVLDEADSHDVIKKGIDVLIDNDEREKALRYLQKAEDYNIISEKNKPSDSATFSCQMAERAIECGVPDMARKSVEKAEKIVDDYTDEKTQTRLSDIAHVYIKMGDQSEAERVADKMDSKGQDYSVGTVRANIRKRFGPDGFWGARKKS